MSADALGTRMKGYEKSYTTKCMPLLPICVRLDGKNFSKWTKGLQRPFDPEMSAMMIEVTRFLVQETQATVGYTQSDEISLIYYSDNAKSQLFFDGKIQKMCSVLAAMATIKFNKEHELRCLLHSRFRGKPHALFDCRVWQVPTLQEAVNTLIWRELDATKNSITMAASAIYSHKQLQGKKSAEKMDLLMVKGINWNDYPVHFKRGTYVRRITKECAFTLSEIYQLPEKHAAKKNPDLKVSRSMVQVIKLPKITSIVNPVDVFFNNKEVITKG